jgi:hypothetical protein
LKSVGDPLDAVFYSDTRHALILQTYR